MRILIWFFRFSFPLGGLMFSGIGFVLWNLNLRTPQPDLVLDTKTELLGAAYKLYGDERIGLWLSRVSIHNKGKGAMYNVTLKYHLTDYTTPSEKTFEIILPQQKIVDFYYPILNETVTRETSGRTLPLEVQVTYRQQNGKVITKTLKKDIKILGRNYLTWTSMPETEILDWYDQFSNYPLLGVFMTPNEDKTKTAAVTCTGGLNTASEDEDRIRAWASIFYCLRNYGVRYIQEPTDNWTPHFNQYVQFPHESISRKAGTCLDLAILFASMAQAVGIDAGVSLLPGHAIPWIMLSNGDYVFVESTFVDRKYAYSHFSNLVSPQVSFEESYKIAMAQIENAINEGKLIIVNYNTLRSAGVVSPW